MKLIKGIFMVCTLLSCTSAAIAQYDGRKFASGSAMLSFSNGKLSNDRSVQTYAYSFSVELGKFKTENRASGWLLSHGLGGLKNDQQFFVNGQEVEVDAKAIRNYLFGVGRFWQFYKHFGNNTGIFGGPVVSANYSMNRNYDQQGTMDVYLQTQSQIGITFGVQAGAYYKFAPKWWLTASLAYTQPFYAQYTSTKYEYQTGNLPDDKLNEFKYSFAPVLTLPSVGLGLRFFPGK